MARTAPHTERAPEGTDISLSRRLDAFREMNAASASALAAYCDSNAVLIAPMRR